MPPKAFFNSFLFSSFYLASHAPTPPVTLVLFLAPLVDFFLSRHCGSAVFTFVVRQLNQHCMLTGIIRLSASLAITFYAFEQLIASCPLEMNTIYGIFMRHRDAGVMFSHLFDPIIKTGCTVKRESFVFHHLS
jgi:hypothetical protein